MILRSRIAYERCIDKIVDSYLHDKITCQEFGVDYLNIGEEDILKVRNYVKKTFPFTEISSQKTEISTNE